jgi:hypothetical protein
MSKISKKNKMILSLTSIGVVILIVILLPRRGNSLPPEPPRTGVRYIPAPTPTPPDTSRFFDPTREMPEVILPRDLQ